MIDGWTVVLDVGKTHAKVSLWDEQGRSQGATVRANSSRVAAGHRVLDIEGIQQWLFETLATFAAAGRIARVIPVGHGAAAGILRAGQVLHAPPDYEASIAREVRDSYALQRDPFSATGSPFLPDGLNLGMQLHELESRHGPLPADATIVPWPQFWAWRLCGVAASEVTSLGCHTDLWCPVERRYSDLAEKRGWAARMAPLRRAGEVLGTITAEVADRTGLPRDCQVLCGLHDSNAALLASRGHAQIDGQEATVLSTGTWFVAMRLQGVPRIHRLADLPEHRDCLINVDVEGRAVPSSRFMGGRDAQIIQGGEFPAEFAQISPHDAQTKLQQLLCNGLRVNPGFVPGVGPFPDAIGEIHNLPGDAASRRIAAALYLALMTDTVLELIDSRERLLVEGRFATDELFMGLLSTLRSDQQVLAGGAGGGLAYGALRLAMPELKPASTPVEVKPLHVDLVAYARDWRRHASDQAGHRTEEREKEIPNEH